MAHEVKDRFPGHACEATVVRRVYPLLSPDAGWPAHLHRWLSRQLVAWRGHPRLRLIRRSAYAVDLEQARHAQSPHWWVVHPMSRFYVVWNAVALTLIAFSLFVGPMEPWLNGAPDVLRLANKTDDTKGAIRQLSNMIIATDIIFGAHILIKMITGYCNLQTCTVVMEPREIVCHYLRGMFLLEAISCVPQMSTGKYLTAVDRQRGDEKGVVVFSVLITLFDLMVIVRLVELLRLVGEFAQFTGASRLTIHMTKFAVCVLVIIHWLACAHLWLPCLLYAQYLGKSSAWLAERKLLAGLQNKNHLYIMCMYRSTSAAMSLGFGCTQHVKTVDDTLQLILGSLLGKAAVAWAIAVLLQAMAAGMSQRVKYRELQAVVRGYLSYRRVPPQLQRRILTAYEHQMEGRYLNEARLLTELPQNLRGQIQEHNSRRLVKGTPLFQGVPASLVLAIVHALREEVFVAGEAVFVHGTRAGSMYFVNAGTVAVYAPSGAEVAHLDDGSHFGEIELFEEGHLRTFSAVAAEITELYRLDADTFRSLFRPMPRLYNRVRALALARANEMADLMEIAQQADQYGARGSTAEED